MTTPRLASLGLALVIALLAVAWGIGAWKQRCAAAAEIQSIIHRGEGNTHEAQARATEPAVADLKAKLEASTARENRLLLERDALLRKVATLQRASHGAKDQGATPAPDANVDAYTPTREDIAALVEVIEKDAETIEALQASSTVKDSLIVEISKARDEWQATAEARERQALAQESATRAWKQAVTSSKWVGRAQGFAAGVALGYIGGKAQ